jgi:NhaA family Na+:H+ antiporter
MSSPPIKALREFLDGESTGGLVLFVAALAALIVANSPIAPIYFHTLNFHIAGLSVLHWINDGLMALFFLLVGLEIKRELLEGHLSTWPRRALPGIAAAGGMVVPAIVYVAFNIASPQTLRGWAIPSATDIAFALGVLAFLGKRVPVSLKIFLTAVAIVDDLGAVAIIAAFYTNELSFGFVIGSVIVVSVLRTFNFVSLPKLWPYLILGALLWFLVLKSGIHATLAGVTLAFTIPLKQWPGETASPLHRLEHSLHPWVTFLVVPLFGFANAGVSFAGITRAEIVHPVTLGIAAGLFFGKQLGISVSVWLAVKLRFGERPRHASTAQIYGVALLGGIGFTMSLFIGLLAFPTSPELHDAVKLGVFAGSLASGVFGAAVLYLAAKAKQTSD